MRKRAKENGESNLWVLGSRDGDEYKIARKGMGWTLDEKNGTRELVPIKNQKSWAIFSQIFSQPVW